MTINIIKIRTVTLNKTQPRPVKKESQNECYKSTRERQIFRALFSCNIRSEIRPFALLPTNCLLVLTHIK